MEYGGLPPRSKPLDVSFMLRFETQENVLQKAKKLPDKELCVVVFMCLFHVFTNVQICMWVRVLTRISSVQRAQLIIHLK